MKTILKRIACALLVLCLLIPSTLAETRPPMLLLGLEDDFPNDGRSFWQRHPEISKRDCDYRAFDDWNTVILTKNPDLFRYYSYQANFMELRKADALADLSNSPSIREATARLRPDIKALVTDENGRILAVPFSAWSFTWMWNQEAWDAAGYSEADVPQTYPEFLDFLERWIARIKENPVKNVCAAYHPNYAEIDQYRDVGWMLAMLIETYELQCAYAGEPLDFDTPEFIDLLKRTRQVGLALFKAEPRSRKRKGMMKLFERSDGDGQNYGFSHALPLRVSREQPILYPASAELVVVSADSPWKAEAIAYLEDRLQTEFSPMPNGERISGLYTDFQAGSYEMKWGDVYTFTEGWLRDMDALEGRFVFAPIRTADLYYAAIKRFMEGDLSAEKLAKQISVPKNDPNE